MAAWSLKRSLLGVPYELDARACACHPQLAAVRWRRGGLMPRLGGWCLGTPSVAAITFGRTVWFGDGVVPSEELLLHEFCHVEQFESVPAFPLRYLWETLSRGYRGNRFEAEARQYAHTARMSADPSREDD